MSLGVDIYNSSDIPKNLRELRVEIKENWWNTFTVPISVLKENYQGHFPYRTLEIINLSPKELAHFNFQSLVSNTCSNTSTQVRPIYICKSWCSSSS